MEDGKRRACVVWHRRAGKDSVGLQWIINQALSGPAGTYWHLFPTGQQGRDAIWEGQTNDGRRFLDFWPSELISHLRNDEMSLRVDRPDGQTSRYHIVGSDNYDRLMGSNPQGVIFSEWSLSDPGAWEYIRPILAINGGWAIFIFTPRGRNHAHTMYQMALDNPDWFAERLTVRDTGVMDEEMLDAERRSGTAEEIIQQEYFCSFDAPLVGSYYGDQMADMLEEGRITKVRHQPELGVETWWDLGYGDLNTIGFVQWVGNEIHCIDYYENNGKALSHYADVLRDKEREHKYHYKTHIFPHDLEAGELLAGKSRKAVAIELGLEPLIVVPRTPSVEDDIETVRNVIPRMWMDESKCDRWLEALRSYRRNWDEKKKVFARQPLHDWSSHAADMTRTGAMAKSRGGGRRKRREIGERRQGPRPRDVAPV